MSHSHDHTDSDGSLKFGLILNSLYTIVEFIFGVLSGSLALIADATHNLTDTLTLTISFVANKVARRDSNDKNTYGFGRATILAALLNATIMVGVAAFIAFEALQRLQNPSPVEGGIVAIVASVGILVNGSIAYVLYKRKHDLNMKSAFIDMAFDALSSLAAVIAGLVIYFTGIQYIDSIVAIIIALLLLYNAIKIIREAVQILLEGTPKDVDLAAITQAIVSTDGILEVDDMHIWAIRSGYNALSCHVVIDDKLFSKSPVVVSVVKEHLQRDFNIHHATIEVEYMKCATHETKLSQ